MAEITRVYKQETMALRFIGKRYTAADVGNEGFGAKWGEWHMNGWFEELEALYPGSTKDIYEDGDAYIGLTREAEEFEYWIGLFLPKDTAVPEGYAYIDLPEGVLGVCWVYGTDVYGKKDDCVERLREEGICVRTDCWFERYVCPRYTTPDAQGNVVLDMCFFTN